MISERTVPIILSKLSNNKDAVDKVFEYCGNPFDKNLLKNKPVLPLENEGHLGDWINYIDEMGDNHFEFLQNKISQLNVPVKENVSKTDAYADISRKGKPFNENNFGGRLKLNNPQSFKLMVNEHYAGDLPVLITSDRDDFITIYRALAFKSEPAVIQDSVNAAMLAGFINWDRVNKYKDEWSRTKDPMTAATGWGAEMSRVAKEESWRFRDRFIILCENAYSSVKAMELGLNISEEEWLKKSTILRTEHEFTHYATKRLYGVMRNNLLDESIADFMGITKAMGEYKAEWFLKFMGLENYPDIRETGRIFTYSKELNESEFKLLCALVVESTKGLEKISAKYYSDQNRERIFLALTFMTLELFACAENQNYFSEAYNKTDEYL